MSSGLVSQPKRLPSPLIHLIPGTSSQCFTMAPAPPAPPAAPAAGRPGTAAPRSRCPATSAAAGGVRLRAEPRGGRSSKASDGREEGPDEWTRADLIASTVPALSHPRLHALICPGPSSNSFNNKLNSGKNPRSQRRPNGQPWQAACRIDTEIMHPFLVNPLPCKPHFLQQWMLLMVTHGCFSRILKKGTDGCNDNKQSTNQTNKQTAKPTKHAMYHFATTCLMCRTFTKNETVRRRDCPTGTAVTCTPLFSARAVPKRP